VLEVGAGVTSVKPGDHVIPLYTPECRQCKSCLSRRTNLCIAIRATQGQGLMPDGSSRFSIGGEKIAHYMGCSTFANHTVLPEIALAKVRDDAPFDKICYIGCGVTTGVGAVIWTAKVWPGANVAVFGLGGIGLNVIQGARMAGADKIIGVDLNTGRIEMARRFGMTDFINPDEVGRDKLVQAIVDLTGGGADFSFECIGNVATIAPGAGVRPSRLGREHHHRRRRRRSGDLDAAVPAGHRPGLAGHRVWRRARSHRRAAHRRLVHGRKIEIDPLITHTLPLERINDAFEPDAQRGEHPVCGGFLVSPPPCGEGSGVGCELGVGLLDPEPNPRGTDDTSTPNPSPQGGGEIRRALI